MARITVMGTGYVGLITGACFASVGHEVTCFDIDAKKIEELKKGQSPIYEPGIEELLGQGIMSKKLRFSTDQKKSLSGAELIFIAVGTPSDRNGNADLKYVKSAAQMIGKNIRQYAVVVNKSTVPVETANVVKRIIAKELEKRGAGTDFDVVSNPEFLAEGTAISDFKKERVVIGTDSKKAKRIMTELYTHGFDKEKVVFVTDVRSAEIIKYTSNAMLALRVSFINEISQLCEKVGANIEDVSFAVGLDSRIGPKFLRAGIGFGGSCFPKDVRALAHTMKHYRSGNGLIEHITKVNELQLENAFRKIKLLLPRLKGSTIAVLGISFKPNTDDIRESPAVKLAQKLQKAGAKLRVYDPKAMVHAKHELPKAVFCSSALEALKGAELGVLATEWPEFKSINLEQAKRVMKSPKLFDGRNLFDAAEVRAHGFSYESVGRP